ncbi:MAG: hypothetical protein KDC66_21385 [Phaeodactylibacter sp.]|nr:hypothetical protein [Phaeodactylibacter sp.]
MGVSIHYRGTLTDKRAVFRFIEEVEDIARTMQWPYTLLDEDWSQAPTAELEKQAGGIISVGGHAGLKGISFIPHPRCESVTFFFNASGIITSPIQVALSAHEGYPSAAQWQFVKTQFAGPDTHVVLVKLFRYLQGKYLHDLEVSDEGGYWETGDYGRLADAINRLNEAIEQLSNDLSAHRQDSDIVAQIEKLLKELKDREGKS